jgi:pimeloyl-ACP methyl ester carboxylesterase
LSTYVLVGGGWLGGWCWKEVARRLRGHGHDAYPVTLTGLGERVHLAGPEIDLDTHIADVVNLMDYEDLNGVVLVGHSYAGVVITGVADRAPGRLARLVYLDTGPPPDGVCLLDVYPPEARQHLERQVQQQGDGWRWPLPPFEELGTIASLAGLSEAQLDRLRAKATDQPFRPLSEPLHQVNAARGKFSRVVILCTEGGFTISRLQELIATGESRLQALASPDWQFIELRSGHWPMLSVPDELADVLHGLSSHTH